MFTCIWQLWDWLEYPPLFTGAMDSKKLHQYHDDNSHLVQNKKSMIYHQPMSPEVIHGTNHSPIFQNQHGHYFNMSPNDKNLQNQNQSYNRNMITSVDSPSQLHGHPNNMLVKSTNLQNAYQQQKQQMAQQNFSHQQPFNKYGAEQLYQTPREARSYHIKAANSRMIVDQNDEQMSNPVTALQQQYQQLQQAKMQAQLKTQNDAIFQQQRTFAMRQALNPPAMSQTYGGTLPTDLSQQSLHSQLPIVQGSHRNVPPSSLNLSSQYQPAQGPIKIAGYDYRGKSPYHPSTTPVRRDLQQETNLALQQHYNKLSMQNKREQNAIGTASGEPSPVYIQQNHPGHVVNQACQTQISGVVGNKNAYAVTAVPLKSTPTSSTEESSTTKSPSHQPIERKKSSGTIQALKSPITKRPVLSPVTLSGWLYKQGSDGLKVWRKRWFVLSEYCLYYYKGLEEEKLLGSILLPSYKVSACLPEDKIYRKFAFKCEHTNMRTYWLAAENSKQMFQWIKALMAATLMQANSDSDQTSQPSFSSANQSGENSDSGIHTFQSQHSKLTVLHGPITPPTDTTGGNGMQPLYANAPPKPRRINDGGYSSPSPEVSNERFESNPIQYGQYTMSPNLQQQSHHAIYDTRTGNVSSKLHIQNSPDNRFVGIHYKQQDLTYDKNNRKNTSPFYVPNDMKKAIENDYRKQLSRKHMNQSNSNNSLDLELQMAQSYAQNQNSEDIYGEKNMQMQRPSQFKASANYLTPGSGMTYPNVDRRTPDAYGRSKNKFQGKFVSDYEDIYNLAQTHHSQVIYPNLGYRRPLSPSNYNDQKHISQMPSQYIANNLESHDLNVNFRNKLLQPIGIIRPHSADFLEYEARSEEATDIKMESKRTPRPKSSLDINRTPDNYYYSEESYAEKMRQSALYLQKSQKKSSSTSAVLSPASNYLSNQDFHNSENLYERTSRKNNKNNLNQRSGNESITNSSQPSSTLESDYNMRLKHADQFLRSASARLPKFCDNDDAMINQQQTSSLKLGERKREESMKRLLEWKQRMLQSPLTRKGVQQNGSPSIIKLGSNPNILSPHGVIQRSHSETNANIGYNSYSSDDEASISVRNLRNVPKVNLTVKPSVNLGMQNNQHHFSNSQYDINYPNENYRSTDEFYPGNNSEFDFYRSGTNNCYPIRKAGSHAEIDLLEKETSSQIRNLDMSAGDLLSRTHEELVLLLIQLRRQNSQIARGIELCCTDIHEAQNRIRTSEGLTRAESITRLDYLKQHLLDLEKQYERSKPLVNLVDNMVKLGSLYRNNENSKRSNQKYSDGADRLEFNQKVQERRLLEEEQKRWDRLVPNQNELQAKVNRLYHLDQLLHEESETLQNLQKDKENLERALCVLRARLQVSNDPPIILEAAKKQQYVLERELSRVHQLLAENSKKLEQTVAGNAHLEQELLILRQKLQASRGSRGSQSMNLNSAGGDSIQYASSTAVLLESELRRVQQLVGDMQLQREELSQAVRELTANSNRLYHEIGNKETALSPFQNKKRYNSPSWTETDLDAMVAFDNILNCSVESSNPCIPLYVDTYNNMNMIKPMLNDNENSHNYRSQNLENLENSGMESDDLLETNPFSNLTNQEKQEIKTVRIVKRESERRQRDRDRSGFGTPTILSTQNLNQVMEEESCMKLNTDNFANRSRSLPHRNNEMVNNYKSNYLNNPNDRVNYNNSPSCNTTSSNNLRKSSLPNKPHSVNNAGSIKYSDYYSTLSNSENQFPPASISDKNCNFSMSTSIQNSRDRKITSDFKNNSSKMIGLKTKTESIQSLTKIIPDINPVFQSEAARQIINEMSGSASEDNAVAERVPSAQKQRRSIPREKRRHSTTPNNVNQKAMQKVLQENDMNRNNGNWRAKDDLDMEVALRPRMNAPDVVRSALGHGEKISENTIDRLFGAPNKILIPERYIPEKTPELSPEEKKRRQEKVEAIKKMLSETPINSTNDTVAQPTADKKQREHLLQLNQILAQQVMQMTKIVAEKAMSSVSKTELSNSFTSEEDQSSPSEDNQTLSLSSYQQRDTFFT